MNSEHLETRSIELRAATAKVAKAAMRYADCHTDGSVDIGGADRAHTDIMRAARELRFMRKKHGMTKHVFFWCEICGEVHCDYCAQTDDTEGAGDECQVRLACFT